MNPRVVKKLSRTETLAVVAGDARSAVGVSADTPLPVSEQLEASTLLVPNIRRSEKSVHHYTVETSMSWSDLEERKRIESLAHAFATSTATCIFCNRIFSDDGRARRACSSR
jgi:hypothetical protein